MKDPCSTCDDDGVLGTSPDSTPCPECMGGEETRWHAHLAEEGWFVLGAAPAAQGCGPEKDALVAAVDGTATAGHFVALPAPFSHGDCYLEPLEPGTIYDCYLEPGSMPCGTCFPAQRARWDADHGDPQDWKDVSVAERASVRRAIDKFRSHAEPARKSAAGATSDPATRPATISSTGPATDGGMKPPSAAVSPRGAR